MTTSVLVVDERLVHAPDSPVDALRSLPSGVYTTVVFANGRAEAWEDHIARLTASVAQFNHQQASVGSTAARTPAAATSSTKPGVVEANLTSLIAISLRLAISAGRGSVNAPSAAFGSRQLATILLCPAAVSRCGSAQVSTTQRIHMEFSITSSQSAHRMSGGHSADEDQQQPTVCVHLKPLQAYSHPVPCTAAVVGPPRSEPRIKRSLWATERRVHPVPVLTVLTGMHSTPALHVLHVITRCERRHAAQPSWHVGSNLP